MSDASAVGLGEVHPDLPGPLPGPVRLVRGQRFVARAQDRLARRRRAVTTRRTPDFSAAALPAVARAVFFLNDSATCRLSAGKAVWHSPGRFKPYGDLQ